MTDKKKIKKYMDTEKMGKPAEPAPPPEGGGRQSAAEAETTPEKSTEEQLEARNRELEQEAQNSYDRLLRVSAEFENYKKRSAREMEEFRKYANESLLKELLPVIDNLERAIVSSGDESCDNSGLIQGVGMTLKGILTLVEKFGVRPIESQGKPFDPNFHQAMMREDNNDYPENTVLNEFQKGYMIHDRLLRPAMVVVSSLKEKSGDSDNR